MSRKSACAGQGACATTEYHSYMGQNACKSQDGCGEHPGENACEGNCAVPLSNKAWKAALAHFQYILKSNPPVEWFEVICIEFK